jgi:hypothetical protein
LRAKFQPVERGQGLRMGSRAEKRTRRKKHAGMSYCAENKR